MAIPLANSLHPGGAAGDELGQAPGHPLHRLAQRDVRLAGGEARQVGPTWAPTGGAMAMCLSFEDDDGRAFARARRWFIAS